MKQLKLNKESTTNALFVVGLVIFTIVVLNLPVTWFTIIMPIAIAVVFIAILLGKS